MIERERERETLVERERSRRTGFLVRLLWRGGNGHEKKEIAYSRKGCREREKKMFFLVL